MSEQLLEQAKLDVALYLRESVAGILDEWERRPGERKTLSLFLEFNFPFFNLKVQKILKERDPHSKTANKWLKKNPCYPIDAYLHAEMIGWIACGDKNILSSLFPQLEMVEWYFLHDLKWFSRLLIAVVEAIEQQIKIDPDASMPKLLQAWCLQREKLPTPPGGWLQGTPEGEAKLAEIKKNEETSTHINKKRIPDDAGQENAIRRRKFKKWVSCWQAELQGLDFEIRLRLGAGVRINND